MYEEDSAAQQSTAHGISMQSQLVHTKIDENLPLGHDELEAV